MNGVGGLGKLVIAIGVALVILGVVIYLLSRASIWGGHPLPGDILIRRRSVTFYFPIITSLVISLILSLILLAIGRFSK